MSKLREMLDEYKLVQDKLEEEKDNIKNAVTPQILQFFKLYRIHPNDWHIVYIFPETETVRVWYYDEDRSIWGSSVDIELFMDF